MKRTASVLFAAALALTTAWAGPLDFVTSSQPVGPAISANGETYLFVIQEGAAVPVRAGDAKIPDLVLLKELVRAYTITGVDAVVPARISATELTDLRETIGALKAMIARIQGDTSAPQAQPGFNASLIQAGVDDRPLFEGALQKMYGGDETLGSFVGKLDALGAGIASTGAAVRELATLIERIVDFGAGIQARDVAEINGYGDAMASFASLARSTAPLTARLQGELERLRVQGSGFERVPALARWARAIDATVATLRQINALLGAVNTPGSPVSRVIGAAAQGLVDGDNAVSFLYGLLTKESAFPQTIIDSAAELQGEFAKCDSDPRGAFLKTERETIAALLAGAKATMSQDPAKALAAARKANVNAHSLTTRIAGYHVNAVEGLIASARTRNVGGLDNAVANVNKAKLALANNQPEAGLKLLAATMKALNAGDRVLPVDRDGDEKLDRAAVVVTVTNDPWNNPWVLGGLAFAFLAPMIALLIALRTRTRRAAEGAPDVAGTVTEYA